MIKYIFVGDGIWSKWGDYSLCSLTCGGGVQTRSRMCTNPAPNKFGQNCTGNNVDEIMCNAQNCSSKSICVMLCYECSIAVIV